jgi:DNA-binding transcriptional ArsR family regulator
MAMLRTDNAVNVIDIQILERVVPIIKSALHPLRLRILDYLRLCDEPQTVSQILDACEAPQAAVSQQLRILKDSRIVTARRRGNNVYYEVANVNVLMLLDCIKSHA